MQELKKEQRDARHLVYFGWFCLAAGAYRIIANLISGEAYSPQTGFAVVSILLGVAACEAGHIRSLIIHRWPELNKK